VIIDVSPALAVHLWAALRAHCRELRRGGKDTRELELLAAELLAFAAASPPVSTPDRWQGVTVTARRAPDTPVPFVAGRVAAARR